MADSTDHETSPIGWRPNRPTLRNHTPPTPQNTLSNQNPTPNTRTTTPRVLDPDTLPGQAKALDGIALRAFLLGLALGLSLLCSLLLAYAGRQIWRVPFFTAALSLFHFLEFYTTAKYNTPIADIDAFLLSRNGRAYNVAHASAVLECVITSVAFPGWRAFVSRPVLLVLGGSAVLMGQFTRSAAMAHAGTNFNHIVQTRKVHGHRLVTSGVYGYLRHPAYFGFFWWGLGTQVVLGNAVCLVGYAFVLWSFFNKRIRKEEELLVDFFGDDYIVYRSRTLVGIPFIK